MWSLARSSQCYAGSGNGAHSAASLPLAASECPVPLGLPASPSWARLAEARPARQLGGAQSTPNFLARSTGA
jgi:hypothetical protein